MEAHQPAFETLKHSSLILFRQVLQKQMPVLQNHVLNKCFETLLSVEHIALFFNDLSLSAIHVIMGKKSKKKRRGRGGRDREIIAIDKFPHCYKCQPGIDFKHSHRPVSEDIRVWKTSLKGKHSSYRKNYLKHVRNKKTVSNAFVCERSPVSHWL